MPRPHEPPWSQLDVGIQEAVRLMWEAGFHTTDSGDGTSKVGLQEDVLPYPHVFAVVPPEALAQEAERALAVPWEVLGLGPPDVEASYCPGDGVALIAVSWPASQADAGLPPPPEDLEVLEGQAGALLWVELGAGGRRLVVERAEQPCALDLSAPLGAGVRLALQDGPVAAIVLPAQEARRLASRIGELLGPAGPHPGGILGDRSPSVPTGDQPPGAGAQPGGILGDRSTPTPSSPPGAG